MNPSTCNFTLLTVHSMFFNAPKTSELNQKNQGDFIQWKQTATGRPKQQQTCRTHKTSRGNKPTA